jgi:hypothetical protein
MMIRTMKQPPGWQACRVRFHTLLSPNAASHLALAEQVPALKQLQQMAAEIHQEIPSPASTCCFPHRARWRSGAPASAL